MPTVYTDRAYGARGKMALPNSRIGFSLCGALPRPESARQVRQVREASHAEPQRTQRAQRQWVLGIGCLLICTFPLSPLRPSVRGSSSRRRVESSEHFTERLFNISPNEKPIFHRTTVPYFTERLDGNAGEGVTQHAKRGWHRGMPDFRLEAVTSAVTFPAFSTKA